MPAVSKSQQKAMSVALHNPEKAKGAAKEMAKSMSKKQLNEYANTSTQGLPEHVKKSEYCAGFEAACAVRGIDPRALLKAAADHPETESDDADKPEKKNPVKSVAKGAGKGALVGGLIGGGAGLGMGGAAGVSQVAHTPGAGAHKVEALKHVLKTALRGASTMGAGGALGGAVTGGVLATR